MQDGPVVECLQTLSQLDQSGPDFVLTELGLIFFVFHDAIIKITCVSEVHDNAERAGQVIEERFLVADDIGVLD